MKNKYTDVYRESETDPQFILNDVNNETSRKRAYMLCLMSIFSIITSLLCVFYVLMKSSHLNESIREIARGHQIPQTEERGPYFAPGSSATHLTIPSANIEKASSASIFAPGVQLHIPDEENTVIGWGSRRIEGIPLAHEDWSTIISHDPDMWIWTGHFGHPDSVSVNCAVSSTNPDCNCKSTWLYSPGYCSNGDVDRAQLRFEKQLEQSGYVTFLDHMCSRLEGYLCAKPVLGVWNDYDYSWPNGNRRLPTKVAMKQVYLDAIREPQSSPRRNRFRGIQMRHVTGAGSSKEISIYLLDARFYRDPLPCSAKRIKCNRIVASLNENKTLVEDMELSFCNDFLRDGIGCCDKDDFFFDSQNGWCYKEENKSEVLYKDICIPSSPNFGDIRVQFIRSTAGQIVDVSFKEGVESHICEVLGIEQRQWLRKNLQGSKSVLNILVSSSPVILHPDSCSPTDGVYDTWECYRPAQWSLFNAISETKAACPIILSSHDHWVDLQALHPGYGKEYAGIYNTGSFRTSLYHFTVGGKGKNVTKSLYDKIMDYRSASNNTYPLETYNLDGNLNEMPKINSDNTSVQNDQESSILAIEQTFGILNIDWNSRKVAVRINNALNGSIALESTFGLDNCAL